MFEKLKPLEDKYEELTEKLALPATLADAKLYQKTAKAHAEIEEIVLCYRRHRKIENDIEETLKLRDSGEEREIRDLAEEELSRLAAEKVRVEAELNGLITKLDVTDQKNAILEIRAGTGGEEASLFAQEIYRMYTHYADRKGWKVEHISSSRTGLGGFKEIILSIEGDGVYGTLKFESGVHRVQRVPETEASGRIHTSAVTVAVLPEAEDVEVHIDEEKDLRLDRFCSSGPGGQSVNTTYSAVRITHLPTGLVVQCQDEKSWHKNKAKALKVLRSRLYEIALREQQSEIAKQRRAMVGTGDRSEKIRTYNYPQNRVTDHRISLTIHRLGEILNGDLDEFLSALRTKNQAERLDEQIEAI